MTPLPVRAPKKLIEVALPLDAINKESALRKRKAPGGYPTAFHKWWAQRPVAAARAVLFGQLVNDPSWRWHLDHPGVAPDAQDEKDWTKKRARLFEIIKDLVRWENTTNEAVLERARKQIRKSWRETCEVNADHPDAATLFNPDKLPGLHDPFAGGGSIPLEAQRLGLKAHASDLNPVAVLINKAMIEIPPKFAGRPPVGQPPAGSKGSDALGDWSGARGLAEDVRRYGAWMRDEAFKRIGHLYPPVEVTAAMVADRPDLEAYVGRKLTVIAWLWARTVASPNPAFRHVQVPLASTFVLNNKVGKESYVQPVLEDGGYRFEVRNGTPPKSAKAGTKLSRGANFCCLMSNVPIEPAYIKAEAVAGRMRTKLMAIVADGDRSRAYLSPTPQQEETAGLANLGHTVEEIHVPLANDPRNLWCLQYGLSHFDNLFTARQLLSLTTFSELVNEVRGRIKSDALAYGQADDTKKLDDGGGGATAYAEAVSLLLAVVVSRVIHYSSSVCTWLPKDSAIARTFTKQAIPMSWDFAEGSVFGKSSAEWKQCLDTVTACIVLFPAKHTATVSQCDARLSSISFDQFVSTDPPYYDNVSYADLADYFYVWHRLMLGGDYPVRYQDMNTPKRDELIAAPYRHGGTHEAESYFLNGMSQVMHQLRTHARPCIPTTIYYAYKQSESGKLDATRSSGWETFLRSVLDAGFVVTGTWPMRTEGDNRQIGIGTNALASSIILVCRPRAHDAETIGRPRFIRELKTAMGPALKLMINGDGSERSPVAPVDLSQAIIGPGMAVFSKYAAVLEADGTPMTVRKALQLINQFVSDDDFDADTQFCLGWFESHGWDAAAFGTADTLARAKGTSVEGVREAGVVESGGGKVRLLRPRDYPADWDAATDTRLPVWEVLHHLVRLHQSEGDAGAGRVAAAVPAKADQALKLAYRLYTFCERKKWADDARGYNELVAGWGGVQSAAAAPPPSSRPGLFDGEG